MISAGLEALRSNLFEGYELGGFYDEMFASPGLTRPHYADIFKRLAGMSPAQFEERRQIADLSFLVQGITFTVYADGQANAETVFEFLAFRRDNPSSTAAVIRWERRVAGEALP